MTSASPAEISLRAVGKRYGRRIALADVDLDVARGEVLGFLGPNGAGKTTTIRIMTGFMRPTSGSVQLLGHDLAQPRAALQARAGLGFVPDVAGLDPQATGLQLLDDLARLGGRPPVDRDDVCRALALAPADLRRPIGALSRGTRQKINLVQGLQHRPALLVLDEPAEGLDPLGKRALFELLGAARERGATVFFSSHVLSEVEELCDRVALIREGRLIAVERIAALRRNLGRRVSFTLSGPSAELRARLSALPGIDDLREHGGRWSFTAGELGPLLRLLATLPLADLAIEPPSLADIFLRLYRPEPPDA